MQAETTPDLIFKIPDLGKRLSVLALLPSLLTSPSLNFLFFAILHPATVWDFPSTARAFRIARRASMVGP